MLDRYIFYIHMMYWVDFSRYKIGCESASEGDLAKMEVPSKNGKISPMDNAYMIWIDIVSGLWRVKRTGFFQGPVDDRCESMGNGDIMGYII